MVKRLMGDEPSVIRVDFSPSACSIFTCTAERNQSEDAKTLPQEVEPDWLIAARSPGPRPQMNLKPTFSGQGLIASSGYLCVWPRPRHLLQRVAAQTLDHVTEALALDVGQALLLVHLQIVHLLLVAQLLLTSLGQTLQLRLLRTRQLTFSSTEVLTCALVTDPPAGRRTASIC